MIKIRIHRITKNSVQGGTDLKVSCNRVDITNNEKCDKGQIPLRQKSSCSCSTH